MLAEARPAPFAFICYPRTEANYVSFLARGLGEQDIDVWYDLDTPSGNRWEEEIADKIAKASAIIVVMANDAGNNKWIHQEVDEAKNRNKTIMTLLLSGRRYPDLKKFHDERVAPDVMPTAAWINQLRRALHQPPAEPPPKSSWWRRSRLPWGRIAFGAGVALVALTAIALIAVPRPAPRLVPDATNEDACGGLSARIVSVSEESPGHTGHRPIVSVIVCRVPADGHQYWLMDYQQEGDRRRFWAKTPVRSGVAPKTDYPVVHSDLTDENSRRTYVVVDVQSATANTINGNSESSRYTGSGQESPAEMPIVSNGVDGVL